MKDHRLEYIKEFNDSIFSNETIKNKNTLIFIYTPPKVGSTTLVTSFRISCARRVNVLHIHDENEKSDIEMGKSSTESFNFADDADYSDLDEAEKGNAGPLVKVGGSRRRKHSKKSKKGGKSRKTTRSSRKGRKHRRRTHRRR